MNMNPYLNVIKAVNFKLYRLHNDTNERIKLFGGEGGI